MLALVMVAFGSSVGLPILTAAVSYTPGASASRARSPSTRAGRSSTCSLRAPGRGRRLPYVAVVEILPNMVNPMLADFPGLRFVFAVLLLSGTLSFLGSACSRRRGPGVARAREHPGSSKARPVVMPAIAIATLTVSVNLLIDSVSGAPRAWRKTA